MLPDAHDPSAAPTAVQQSSQDTRGTHGASGSVADVDERPQPHHRRLDACRVDRVRLGRREQLDQHPVEIGRVGSRERFQEATHGSPLDETRLRQRANPGPVATADGVFEGLPLTHRLPPATMRIILQTVLGDRCPG